MANIPSAANITNPPSKQNNDQLEIEHFKHLCELQKHFNDKLIEAITFHVTTFSLIIAGVMWLVVEKKIPVGSQIRLASLADAVVIMLSIVTIIRIIGNLRAWFNARVRQHQIFPQALPPRLIKSLFSEFALVTIVALGGVFFIITNPIIIFGLS